MKRHWHIKEITVYLLMFSLFIIITLAGNRTVTVLSQNDKNAAHVIIDAGHGGVDGGAVSCTGIRESQINLEIALKLNDLMHLLGIETVMIRNTDISVYTQGNTIAAKKISDICERVRLVNTTPKALLVSIHQNTFSDPQYSGAQIFYNGKTGSQLLAETLQNALRTNLDPLNKRKCKPASGIYLMEHINCTGILIECGFLSNPTDEENLRNTVYQNKICTVIATTISQYLNT